MRLHTKIFLFPRPALYGKAALTPIKKTFALGSRRTPYSPTGGVVLQLHVLQLWLLWGKLSKEMLDI